MSTQPAFQNQIIPLEIEPLDPLFFRDGRPFEAGNSRGRSGLPTPRTLSGMIRWHLAERLNERPARYGALRKSGGAELPWLARLAVRGPWLARRSGPGNGPPKVFVPAPAHLLREGKDPNGPLRLLTPLRRETPLPGWHQPNPYPGQPDLVAPWGGWTDEPLNPVGELLTPAGLRKVLGGQLPRTETSAGEMIPPGALFDFEERIGLGIDPATQTAQEGLLYSIRMLRLQSGVCFYAELGVEEDDARAFAELKKQLPAGSEWIAPFGGEGRRVAVRVLDKAHPWPHAGDSLPGPDEGGFTSLLITPAVYAPNDPRNHAGRQFPPMPLGTLVGAALGQPTFETGWRHQAAGGAGGAAERSTRAAGRPRPMRSLVPPGSIYFWQKGRNAADDKTLPSCWQLAQSNHQRSSGYGLALRGVWSWWR